MGPLLNRANSESPAPDGVFLDDAALDHLARAAEAPEASRSSYWEDQAGRFRVDRDGVLSGETVLGNVSRKRGPLHDLGHGILQIPYRWMARDGATYARCIDLARRVARDQDRQLTSDIIRQALTLNAVLGRVPTDDQTACNLVIGDGFGVLSALFLLATPGRKTVTVNLTKSLLLDLACARRSLGEGSIAVAESENALLAALDDPSVRLIGIRADHAAIAAAAPIGVAVNVVSMQEMTPDAIAGYFRILRANPATHTVFYCCNKLWKRLPDGTEARFMDYPWRDDDTILHEGPCPWSQWYYDKRPPFWHYRRGESRVIWHRLAEMAKEPESVDAAPEPRSGAAPLPD